MIHVYIVRQYNHYTVTEDGEDDELEQEEVIESAVVADYPYYCYLCGRDFETWDTARAHLPVAS